MSRLFDAYRACHEQGFIPIFVKDEFDTRTLVEACVAAGMQGIEYTLRREDAREMIPWIRENYPDLYLLVGSTLDDERIVRKMRRKHSQLMTVAEVADLGVDGFVSMLGWRLETIEKYSPTHIVIPTAMTVTEALQQVGAGAHLVKALGSDLDFVKRCRLGAAFDYCPLFVTGGMTPERMPEAMEAGAAMTASGFDLILKGQPCDISVTGVARELTTYLDATRRAREAAWPEMMAATDADRQTWLDALPHYHPF